MAVMDARFLGFVLGSLGLHLAALWLLLNAGSFEPGFMSAPDTATSTLTVRILATEYDQSSRLEKPLEIMEPFGGSAQSLEEIPEKASVKPAGRSGAASLEASATAENYLDRGRLTRLPAPLGHIDLNAEEISALAFDGQTSMTILIDEDGTVAHVIAPVESEHARKFTERVAERFRHTRFTPGEINGKAVKSQLQITVVSETATELP